MIVVDASVLVKLFLAEADDERAVAIFQRNAGVLAPEIAATEVASAITRRFRNGEITEAHTRTKLTEWDRFTSHRLVKLMPNPPLIPPAAELSIQLKHPLVDCLYLALAQERQTMLVTADHRFVESAKATYRNIFALRDFPS